jgi:hypothetical protein
MAKCFLHPGRDSVITVAAKNYCQKCKDGQQAAAAEVALKNKHVEPKSCFVTYRGGDSWLPFLGTGCAHWVAHQLDISTGAASNQCLEGHSIRVPDVIQGKPKIAIDDVAVNDIWANDALTHMGLVSKVHKKRWCRCWRRRWRWRRGRGSWLGCWRQSWRRANPDHSRLQWAGRRLHERFRYLFSWPG